MKKILIFIATLFVFVGSVKAENVTLVKDVYDNTYVYYYDRSGQKKYIAKEGSWGGWGSQAQFSGYHPCNKTHEAESDSGFISGFIDDQSTRDDEATPVVIWTENGTNVHCTTRLDINTWETAKS